MNNIVLSIEKKILLFERKIRYNLKPLHIKVLGIEETIDYILEHKSSVVRFGDGENKLINGTSIGYQDYDPELSKVLSDLISSESNERFLVCVADVFDDYDRYNDDMKIYWYKHLIVNREMYKSIYTASWYGSAFISRPYMDLKDKRNSKRYFDKLRQVWEDQDLLIVEGTLSRSGTGNDLFDNAKSVKRIICPSKNAFSKVDVIQQEILKYAKGRLILVMLGPTAKVLVKKLSDLGYQAIDIGHIDSEYEWYKMGATHKVKIPNKHTAELDDGEVSVVEDKKYQSEILTVIDD